MLVPTVDAASSRVPTALLFCLGALPRDVRPSVLVIAGSDSSGGAGIQADLKALDHIGVHAAVAVTCVTSQNSTGVRSIYPLTPGAVLDQATEVLDDLDIRAIKCGMLYSEAVIRAVADLIQDRDLPAVVDPVLAATSGGRLAKDGGAQAYARHLVPVAWAVTPNAHEAEALLGRTVRTDRQAADAARKLVAMGARAAVVKGGHLASEREVVDTLAVRGRIERVRSPRVRGEFHGAGCHFASFMAGFAARGLPPARAFRLAHGMLQQAILNAEPLGRGPRFLETPAQRFVVEEAGSARRSAAAWHLAEAALELAAVLSPRDIPEVGVNFGYALPRPRGPEDVCAIDGRIVVSSGRPVLAGPVRFGASRHVARILLACAKVAPSMRSACNLRPPQNIRARARRARLSLAHFDRAEEPPSRSRLVSTMSWGTAATIRTFGRVPDLIFDGGAPGKEPMVRVLGRSPSDVVAKVRRFVGASR